MAIVKLGSSDDVNKTQVGDGGGYYDGPPPKPGYYTGIIKSMKLGKIASGKNQGADRIELLIEINRGDFKEECRYFSTTRTSPDQGRHMLTSSYMQSPMELMRIWLRFAASFGKRAHRLIRIIPDNRGYCAFIRWGPWKIENNLVVGFNTKMGVNRKTGEPRAEIIRFVNKKPADDVADEDDDDVDSIADADDDIGKILNLLMTLVK